ncbi:hypothetical protein [Mitsuaria sp. GD03876]|uniref:hypothetical protein n=1 Tax=Mitsuaria sp. GD03876 TaxID=2975399 RepID=UPI0024479911|nr:hypothetical protein [Mitsuaria sp. GD03876]MDH0868268.1 hypothetical protein [Mitsuaria sp. GD03876]
MFTRGVPGLHRPATSCAGSLPCDPPALSSQARAWLAELRRAGVWCAPQHRHRLMQALGAVIPTLADFPAGHRLSIDDRHSAAPPPPDDPRRPGIRLVALDAHGRPGALGDRSIGYLVARVPASRERRAVGVRPLPDTPDAFFVGLLLAMREAAQAPTRRGRPRAGPVSAPPSPADVLRLRERVVDALAASDPAGCNAMAAEMALGNRWNRHR